MTESTRRTFVKGAGATLFGASAVGKTLGQSQEEIKIDLLELHLSFDIDTGAEKSSLWSFDIDNGDEKLDLCFVDRPIEYEIDLEKQKIKPHNKKNVQMIRESEWLVNFDREFSPQPSSLGGGRKNAIFVDQDRIQPQSAYVYSPNGYNVPEFSININSKKKQKTISSSAIQDQKNTLDSSSLGESDLLKMRLHQQQLNIRTRKIIDTQDKEVIIDNRSPSTEVPRQNQGKTVQRSTMETSVTPYITGILHRNLELVLD